MFDDPKKELERLEKELLAARTDDEAFEHFYDEILEEFGPKKTREEEDYLKDILEEIPSLAEEGPNAYRDHTRPAAAPRKEKSNLPLVLILCLECLGIAGVAAWWLMRLL